MKPNQKHKTIITPTVCKGQKEKVGVTFWFWTRLWFYIWLVSFGMAHQARDRLACSWPDLCSDSKSSVSVGVFNSWCSSDQWAIQFLQLEKLYHQRLLSNLAALQDNWGTATHLFLPSERFYQRLNSECNSVKYACFQRASGERGRTPGAVCLLRRTASVRNTLRSWVRSAAHTSGTPRHTNTRFIAWNQSTLHGWS